MDKMVKREELIKVISETIGTEFLNKAERIDDNANGVQIFGGEDVSKVALGVSLNEEFLEEAARRGSNFCIFHHGLDARTHKGRLSSSYQKRLKLIFQNSLTICGFHYALDAHPEFGNNVTIIKELGARVDKPLLEEWGYTGIFSSPQDIADLKEKCQELFKHPVIAFNGGSSQIKTIGVVSGAAKPYTEDILEMEEKEVDLFISGESSESAPYRMKECGFNYFVCGHYATEKFGVQELGNKIKEHFKDQIEVEFIDIPNSI